MSADPAELAGKRWPLSRGLDLMLRPLPQSLPSMFRQQRLCRIALRSITVEIGQRYAREATSGADR